MVCPKCGADVTESDHFCPHCGERLPTTSMSTEEPSSTDLPSGQRFEPYPVPSERVGTEWSALATTPDSTAVGAPLATWWQRVGASLLDDLIVGAPLGVVTAILNAAFGTRHAVVFEGTTRTVTSIQGGAHLALYIFSALCLGVYLSVLNGTGTGQTFGNRAPGIAVRDAQTGEVIGLKRGIVRWLIRALLYAALVVPGIVNDLFPLWDPRRQSIADKIAHTVVIRVR